MIYIFFNDLSENLIQCVFYEVFGSGCAASHDAATISTIFMQLRSNPTFPKWPAFLRQDRLKLAAREMLFAPRVAAA
jgi:hypothetical protein